MLKKVANFALDLSVVSFCTSVAVGLMGLWAIILCAFFSTDAILKIIAVIEVAAGATAIASVVFFIVFHKRFGRITDEVYVDV